MYLTDQLTQLYPPKPGFTGDDLPLLHGKVYIVTGASGGVGKELTRILYNKGGRVYVAARSEEKATKAIDDIRKTVSSSNNGELIFLPLDLADLTTIKASAHNFLRREEKLHVLFNNAGVMHPPAGSKTAQGYELQLGVNCLGTFLFTKLLTPLLVETAKTEPPATVRVVWVSSTAIEAAYGLEGGIDIDNLDYHKPLPLWTTYAVSKAGNFFHGTEFARRYKADGVVSIPLNPGILDSDLWRWQGRLAHAFFKMVLLHPPILGAYCELFAGLSPDVTLEKTGKWVIPWGRFQNVRSDLEAASRSASEPGGTGIADKFWEWSEEQIKPHL
ncbi:NAD(P)-binding protein [Hypoxylon rubiginosum]|uniref:NAD(P)-binding protein n=1 Tax=Hypoxylon rubiginosum TaxID=110542 RepID=A0ACB9YGY6_9PEZI|nr:NAD(P)-binding protein [Hypoxylon rubiginosum]